MVTNKLLNILHIANDYCGSAVYKNLFSTLDEKKVVQIVYTPIRSVSLLNRNYVNFDQIDSRIFYRHVINTHYDKVLFKNKITRIANDVIDIHPNLEECNLIHAHTWFSDGGVAYLLNRRFHVPYIITIRNTDLNIFYKYFIHLRSFGMNVLRSAQRIIFISQAYYDRFKKLIPECDKALLDKCQIIPNGVDHYWLDNSVISRKSRGVKPYQLLYVGRFTKGKNLTNLINAVSIVNQHEMTIKLNIVGGGGGYEKAISLLIRNASNVEYLGQIKDKEILKEIYRTSDFFVMPSRGETFGLVYVEALLQGLPILYTKDEGIDGMYNNIGEKILFGTAEEIAKLIKVMIEKQDQYCYDLDEIRINHDWKIIGDKYYKIYNAEI